MTGNDKRPGDLQAARPASGDLVDRVLEGNLRTLLFESEEKTELGRLRLERPLGSGAMGAVLVAFDPVLDRRVAVKILQPDQREGSDALLREARVLAKLDHANVITIHDVLEVGDELYLIMELIEDGDLRKWIGKGRDWKEVVELFTQLGHGLSAVHALGIAHCDVKPENVVISKGRPRLIDFGLAHQRSEIASQGGTPAYLAPERVEGGRGSAAADQYAFFSSLVEAIEGERPRVDQRWQRMPRWLEEVARRGLSPDPEDRFETMEAAVAALQRKATGHRWLLALAALLLLSLTLTLVLGNRGASAGSSCEVDFYARSGIDKVKLLRAGDKATRLVELIEEHAQRWQEAASSVCKATESGVQSEALLDTRMRCLDVQARRAGALLRGQGTWVNRDWARALESTADLEEPVACQSSSTAEGYRLPANPELRARIIREEGALADVWGDFSMGRYPLALVMIDEIVARTESLDDPGFLARRDLLHATLLSRAANPALAGPVFEKAMERAATMGASELEARIWLGRLRHELLSGDPQRMLEWRPFARAALRRAGMPTVELEGLVGEAFRHLGRLGEARTLLEGADRALLLPLRRAIHIMNLGSVFLALDEPAAAAASFEAARELVRQTLGEDHPAEALYLDKQAQAAHASGDTSRALALWEQAIDLRTRAYGGRDRATASSLLHSIDGLIEANRLAQADDVLAQVADIRADIYQDGHPRLEELRLVRARLSHARLQHKRALDWLAPMLKTPVGELSRAAQALILVSILDGSSDAELLRSQVERTSSDAPSGPVSLDQLTLATHRVRALLRLGETESAETLAGQLDALGANESLGARSFKLLGMAREAVGDVHGAVGHYERALHRSPQPGRTRDWLQLVLEQQRGAGDH